ncbi:MAG TPA: hotdog fold thioesterase [Chitinophagales bacterium]|nr:hotdog fold thioesterase [Chitinophagales bacterium]
MSNIWFDPNTRLEDFAHWGKNTLGDHLGMQFTNIGDDFLEATMPVDHRTHQPYGLLHGGASVALAETIGSVASALVINHATHMSLGVEINANHLRSVRSGIVTAKCTPIHIGGTIHVWNILISDSQQRPVCISRLTVMIRKR